jgi:hypothetical protein
MQKLSWLCLFGCLCATQASANSVNIVGAGLVVENGYNVSETTTTVWLFGHNTNPLALGALSIDSINVGFVDYNEFFVLRQQDADALIAAELKRLHRPDSYPGIGFVWKSAKVRLRDGLF